MYGAAAGNCPERAAAGSRHSLRRQTKPIVMKYLMFALALACGIMTSCTGAQNESAMEKNETLENLKTRRSIRAYEERMPPKDLIEKVLEAGTYAPTGKGSQSPVIVAVTDKATRDKLSRMNAAVMGMDSDPFYGAPVVVVVLADRKFPTYLYDGSLVMGNLLNAAHAAGLGSCWIHRAKEVFDSDEGKALLKEWGIEGDYEGIGNCILGYSAQEAPAPKPRKADYIRFIE